MFLLRFCSHPLSSHRRVFFPHLIAPQFPLRHLAPSCIAAACKADRQVGVWPIGRSLIGLAVGVLCPGLLLRRPAPMVFPGGISPTSFGISFHLGPGPPRLFAALVAQVSPLRRTAEHAMPPSPRAWIDMKHAALTWRRREHVPAGWRPRRRVRGRTGHAALLEACAARRTSAASPIRAHRG